MQKITTSLWFDTQAEEAAAFYTSLFRDSKILGVSHYGEAGPGPPGGVLAVTFQLAGQEFIAINGGPVYTFTPAVSLSISCETQDEVDSLWETLGAGGAWSNCGWLTDRYGLSWQIVPRVLGELLQDPEPARANRVMAAMLQMKKLDIAGLRQAYEAVA